MASSDFWKITGDEEKDRVRIKELADKYPGIFELDKFLEELSEKKKSALKAEIDALKKAETDAHDDFVKREKIKKQMFGDKALTPTDEALVNSAVKYVPSAVIYTSNPIVGPRKGGKKRKSKRRRHSKKKYSFPKKTRKTRHRKRRNSV